MDNAAEFTTITYRAPELFNPEVGNVIDSRYEYTFQPRTLLCTKVQILSLIICMLFYSVLDIELFCMYCICGRTDVWSLGCLLFAWWYGYSPFESEFVRNTIVDKNNGKSQRYSCQRPVHPIRVTPFSSLRILSPVAFPEYEGNKTNAAMMSDIYETDGGAGVDSWRWQECRINELVARFCALDYSKRPFIDEVLEYLEALSGDVKK